jgi:polyhydroxyalkanoate synthesis regulator phasin
MLEDVRKYLEAALENLSAAKAQQLARQLLEPDARKEQVAKTTQELLDWSQRNRERLTQFISRELRDQLAGMGVATQKEVDALKKRVRDLERAAGKVTPARKERTRTAKPPARARAGAKKRSAAKKIAPKRTGA